MLALVQVTTARNNIFCGFDILSASASWFLDSTELACRKSVTKKSKTFFYKTFTLGKHVGRYY